MVSSSFFLTNKANNIKDKHVLELNEDNFRQLIKSDAKIFKISSKNIFFNILNDINVQSFPYLFVFVIYDKKFKAGQINNIQKCLNKYFLKRPLVLELIVTDKQNNTKRSKLFYKEDEANEFCFYNDNLEMSNEENYNFPRFYKELKSSEKAINDWQNLRKCGNVLVLRLSNIFHAFKKVRFEIAEKIIILKDEGLKLFKSTLDFRFDFNKRLISARTKELVEYCENKNSLLKLALLNRKENLIFFLLDNYNDVFEKWDFNYKKELSKIAYDYPDELREIFLFLIKCNFPFPDNFDESKFENASNTILKDQKRIHNSLQNDTKNFEKLIDDVYNETDKMTFSSVCYDYENTSLLKKAFNICRKAEINSSNEGKRYKLYVLVKRRFKALKPDEDFIDNEIKNIEIEQKINAEKASDEVDSSGANDSKGHQLNSKGIINDINEIALSLSTPHVEIFSRILARRSKVHDRGNYDIKTHLENSQKIDEYFDELGKITEISDILKVTALSYLELQIYFDFEQETTHEVIFQKRKDKSLGLAYKNGTIIIGAKNPETVLRTLAHELCHVAMQTTYHNNFLPYFNNEEDKNKFAVVLDACEKEHVNDNINSTSDSIVPKVFMDHKGKEREFELIVRVPEMIAHFKEKPERLKKCKDLYPSLFDHFNDITIRDMKNFDTSKKEKIIKLNQAFGQSDKNYIQIKNSKIKITQKFTLVITNAPKVAIADIKRTNDFFANTNTLFVSAKRLANSKHISDLFNEVFKSGDDKTYVNPEIVVDISQVFKTLHPKQVLDKLFGKSIPKFIIIATHESSSKIKEYFDSKKKFDTLKVVYSWKDIKEKTRIEKLKSRLVTFQSKEIRVHDLIHQPFTEVPQSEEFLRLMFSNEELSVNKIETDEKRDQMHIARTLIMKIFVESSKEEVDQLRSENSSERSPENQENTPHNNGTDNVKSSNFEEEKIFDEIKNLKIVLISSEAGSGKSQTLKKIQEKIISKNISNLTYFVDLKLFIKNFEKIVKNDKTVDFKKFFIENILASKSTFEKIFFEHFYNEKEIFILFDGFDEISPVCKGQVLTLIKAFKGNKQSQLWITTRSHLEVDLRIELGINEILELKAFEDSEIETFLVKFWKKCKIQGNPKKLAKALIERLKRGKKVEENKESDEEIPRDPQTLSLFAEACILNGEINEEFFQSFTKYKIYNKSITKKIEIWSHERGDQGKNFSVIIQDSSMSFSQVHQFYAMKSFFDDSDPLASPFELYLEDVWKNNEEISRCGIITTLTDENVIFLHETFKEYFVADFMVKGLRDKPRLHLGKSIRNIIDFLNKREKLHVVNMFISGGLKEIKFSENQYKQLAEILEENLSAINSHFLTTAVLENYESLYMFLLDIFKRMSSDAKFYQLQNYELIFNDDTSKINYTNVRAENFENIFLKLCNDEDFSPEVKSELNKLYVDYIIELRKNTNIGKKFKELHDLLDVFKPKVEDTKQ